MNKTISRKDILAAIRKEPLQTGVWVEMETRNDKYVPLESKNCSVCAVGAVLRKAGLTNAKVVSFGKKTLSYGPVGPAGDDVTTDQSIIQRFLDEKRYLHALSMKFESQAERTGTTKTTRNVLIKFVKDNFPKRIRLNPRF